LNWLSLANKLEFKTTAQVLSHKKLTLIEMATYIYNPRQPTWAKKRYFELRRYLVKILCKLILLLKTSFTFTA